MRVSPLAATLGTLLIVFAATLAAVYLPLYTMHDAPSDAWRRGTALEEAGRQRYIANGCTYCHSQYVRLQDWGEGAERFAQSGDYFLQSPPLLGSERTGPDLSEEGGEHGDDWHVAHFTNPRFTRPLSLMPRFAWEGPAGTEALTAYVQSLGGKNAEARVAAQRRWRADALAAFREGPDGNVTWLHSRIPEGWRRLPSPYPASEASLRRGEAIYLQSCVGCHGPVGDGRGPAAPFLEPTPLNFTTLGRHLEDGKWIGGILYYQIMNGVTVTAMTYFKKDLESAKIWDVGNFIAAYFIGHRDDRLPSVGIPASYEGREAPREASPGGAR